MSFARALRRSRLKALGLVLPLFAFLLITFLVPIGDMLFRSVENQLVGRVLHRTVAALADWDPASGELPGEPVFEALVADFVEGRENRTTGRVGVRLNYELGGMSSLFRKTGRRAKRIREAPLPRGDDSRSTSAGGTSTSGGSSSARATPTPPRTISPRSTFGSPRRAPSPAKRRSGRSICGCSDGPCG